MITMMMMTMMMIMMINDHYFDFITKQINILLKYIFQDNYNKKIAPFSFDKINNVNIPVNINVSMSVIDIIKIAEVGDDYHEMNGVEDKIACYWCCSRLPSTFSVLCFDSIL